MKLFVHNIWTLNFGKREQNMLLYCWWYKRPDNSCLIGKMRSIGNSYQIYSCSRLAWCEYKRWLLQWPVACMRGSSALAALSGIKSSGSSENICDVGGLLLKKKQKWINDKIHIWHIWNKRTEVKIWISVIKQMLIIRLNAGIIRLKMEQSQYFHGINTAFCRILQVKININNSNNRRNKIYKKKQRAVKMKENC